MTCAYLEVHAHELRAWARDRAGFWRPIRLEADGYAMPLVVYGKHRRLVVGQAAAGHLRADPHLTQGALLTILAQDEPITIGRHTLRPDAALGYIVDTIRSRLSGVDRVLVAVPTWLPLPTADKLLQVLRRLQLDIVCLVPRGLLLGLEAATEPMFSHEAWLAELDEAALTITHLYIQDGLLQRRRPSVIPALSRAAWRESLLNAVAETAILQFRRDPRALAEVDQAVFAAVDAWLSRPEADGHFAVPLEFPRTDLQVTVTLTAEQVQQALSGLAKATVRHWLASARRMAEPSSATSWLLSRELACLPGVLDQVRQHISQALEVEVGQSLPRTAASLIQRWQRGELHWSPPLLSAIPLPEAAAAEFVFDAEVPAQSSSPRGS